MKWNSIKLRYDNGIRASDLDSAKGITITGAYSDGHAATGGLELYTDAADTKTFITASGGIYTFTYNVTAKTLDIQAKKQEGTGTNTEAEIPVSSVNSDTTEGIAVWSAGTKFHTFEGGWGAATGSVWRSYVIVDKDGHLRTNRNQRNECHKKSKKFLHKLSFSLASALARWLNSFLVSTPNSAKVLSHPYMLRLVG